jgi:hypothetical protein
MSPDDIRGLLLDRTGTLKYDLLRLDREQAGPGPTEPDVDGLSRWQEVL